MNNGEVHIDSKKCFGCGTCILNCPNEALRLELMRPPEHDPEEGTSIVDARILEDEKP